MTVALTFENLEQIQNIVQLIRRRTVQISALNAMDGSNEWDINITTQGGPTVHLVIPGALSKEPMRAAALTPVSAARDAARAQLASFDVIITNI